MLQHENFPTATEYSIVLDIEVQQEKKTKVVAVQNADVDQKSYVMGAKPAP
jgi:hypothetical protein